MEDKILNQLEFENKNLYQQLVFAEAKHGILIGLVGAIMVALINIVFNLKDPALQWLQYLLIVHIVVFFISMCISFKSFFPKLNKNNYQREYNLFFFGDIQKFNNGKKYVAELNNTESLCEQLAEQN